MWNKRTDSRRDLQTYVINWHWFWARFIHLWRSQPVSLASILMLSSDLLLGFPRGLSSKMLRALFSHHSYLLRQSCLPVVRCPNRTTRSVYWSIVFCKVDRKIAVFLINNDKHSQNTFFSRFNEEIQLRPSLHVRILPNTFWNNRLPRLYGALPLFCRSRLRVKLM